MHSSLFTRIQVQNNYQGRRDKLELSSAAKEKETLMSIQPLDKLQAKHGREVAVLMLQKAMVEDCLKESIEKSNWVSFNEQYKLRLAQLKEDFMKGYEELLKSREQILQDDELMILDDKKRATLWEEFAAELKDEMVNYEDFKVFEKITIKALNELPVTLQQSIDTKIKEVETLSAHKTRLTVPWLNTLLRSRKKYSTIGKNLL
jgi:hypothetical protein